MGLIIDTNIFIDAENGRLKLDNLNVLSESGDSYIAAITVSELLAGIHLAKTSNIQLHRSAFVEGIISKLTVLDFTEEVARSYGLLYAHILKLKTKANTSVHDLQIAATCITHGYSLLTNNVADYKKIPGINILKPN